MIMIIAMLNSENYGNSSEEDGTKRMERLAKARLSPISKPLHINSIFTVNTPILYI